MLQILEVTYPQLLMSTLDPHCFCCNNSIKCPITCPKPTGPIYFQNYGPHLCPKQFMYLHQHSTQYNIGALINFAYGP